MRSWRKGERNLVIKAKPRGPAPGKNIPAAQDRARRARRRRTFALLALLFPLLFATVIAVGLLAMAYRHMEIFRPSHGSTAHPTYTLQAGAALAYFAQR